MGKTGLALAREREKNMLSRMAEILDWDDEGEVKQALKRLGLIPGSDEFEEALSIWRDLR
ncbi:MAG TPA: hypothetical protein VNW47_08280 [Terriglobales bacterium]|jgi:hypothetical protein|nr:hypothetical protein [Terriglobales bacterium]